MSKRIVLIAAALAAGCLGGCGKTGTLERPAPMFDGPAREKYEAAKTTAAAKAAAARAAESNEQNNTVFDPAAGPPADAPNAAPLPGVTTPFAPGPSTAGQNQNNAPDQ